MKLQTAFKLSALAAALSVSVPVMAAVQINGNATPGGGPGAVITTYGSSGITLNGNTNVTGSLTVSGANVIDAIVAKASTAALNDEISAREDGDTAIRDEIAAGITTGSLEVNGPVNVNTTESDVNFNIVNGNFNVNAVNSEEVQVTPTQQGSTFQVDTLGEPDSTLPIAYTDSYTRGVEQSETTQVYTSEKLEFNSQTIRVDQERKVNKTAQAVYDENGEFVGVNNVTTEDDTGYQNVDEGKLLSQDKIIVGRENAGDLNALTIRSTTLDANNQPQTTETKVTATGISTDAITLAGEDLATTLADESARLDQAIVDGVADAKDYTDTTAATLRDQAAAESARVNTAIVDGDTATLAAANATTASTAATLRGEAAAESARVNTAIVDGDAVTLAAANATTASTAQTLRTEAAAESARVNTAIVDGDAATLASANAYTNTQVANVNSRMNQLNSRVDDVEKTAYRGIAIALAAQQQIPNIGAGQFAVFGGVGHYEGESAGALGVASVFADGRTSVSAALGFAGGNEVGGRVGVSYVFGGK